jgi:hypothetical protein
MREALLAAGVLAVGLGLGSSVVMLETQDASATATLRTFALRLPVGATTSDCVDYQNNGDYKHTISTKTSKLSTYARINTCNSMSVYYNDCQNNCGTWSNFDDQHFLPHTGVDILSGAVYQGDFGWLGTTPGHGDRTQADPTSLVSCYVKPANGDLTDDTPIGWVIDGSATDDDGDNQALCVASANFE